MASKLQILANRISDASTLRAVFVELNYDYDDSPVSMDTWTDDQKKMCIDARIVANKNGYRIVYVQTNSDKMKHWNSIATKIIRSYQGLCIVCSHNPRGLKWSFSSLAAEFTPKFNESRHVPIDITPSKPAPSTFIKFLDALRVSKGSTPAGTAAIVSEAFDKFAIAISDELTINVFEALKVLSEGIVDDPANNLDLNEATLEKIRVPTFILLYRIMFILYAEDRSVFPQSLYYYDQLSLRWVKENWILKTPSDIAPYGVHERLQKLFKLIEVGSDDAGYRADDIRMRPYYGRLFDRKKYPDLEKWQIPNENLLQAIGLLTRTKDKDDNYFFLDYAALETRHLGAIYERLLEYHLKVEHGKVADLPNNAERKSTGSYYTPQSLVDHIVKNALDPLINDIVKNIEDPSEQIDKILDLNILDPAMGSGHFLVGAINHMARRICEIEFSDDIPDGKLVERKRDVARRCVYGVDLNPLAVDLAHVSIWLETIAADRPLSFLSAHLKSGNSLIGLSLDAILDKQTLLIESISDRVEFKKTIRNFITLESLDDDTADAVRAKIAKYDSLLRSGTVYYNLKFLLDMKAAKLFGIDIPPIDNYSLVGENILDYHFEGNTLHEITDHSTTHSFFHYQLEFPDVFYDENGILKANPGFDAIIGNPPWEILKPDSEDFFANIYDQTSDQKFRNLTKPAKKKIIKKLLCDASIEKKWLSHQKKFKVLSNYFSRAGYTRQSSALDGKRQASDLNLFKLFFERVYDLLKPMGYCGLIVPAGIYSDMGCRGLRQMIFKNTKLQSLDVFINTKQIFKSVHRQFKFCLLCYRKGLTTTKFSARFYMKDPAQLYSTAAFTYPAKLVEQYSPNALSVIQLQDQNEVALFEKLYHYPLLSGKLWNLKATSEFHLTSDSGLFNTNGKGHVLYEGKMIHQFYNSLAGPTYHIDIKKGTAHLLSKELKRIKKHCKDPPVKPQLDYEDYRLAWRDVTNAVDRRTLIASVLPPNVFLGNTLNYIRPYVFDDGRYKQSLSYDELVYLCGVLNSFPIDFILRHRVNLHVSIFFFKELPVPRYDNNNPYHRLILQNTTRLLSLNKGFLSLRRHLGVSKSPVSEQEQLTLKAQTNAAVCKAFGITKTELELILKYFQIEDQALKALTLSEFDMFG